LSATGARERKARCGCGGLTVSVRGEPLTVYACSCINCQRLSGSAFTYSAFWPAAAVSIEGARTTWRWHGDSGRWIESLFCPTCGVTVCFRAEARPDVIGISVGCFADPGFPPPARLFWASRRHPWLTFPDTTELDPTQSE
jgi:hypothetical protein